MDRKYSTKINIVSREFKVGIIIPKYGKIIVEGMKKIGKYLTWEHSPNYNKEHQNHLESKLF